MRIGSEKSHELTSQELEQGPQLFDGVIPDSRLLTNDSGLKLVARNFPIVKTINLF